MDRPATHQAANSPDRPASVRQAALRIVGMSRSGNHAIINWLLNQLAGKWVFLNCVEPRSNPFETARPLDCGNRVLASEPHLRGAEERQIRRLAEWLVFSQEDTFLGPALDTRAMAAQGLSRAGADIIVLRDPYNLMASRKRFGWRPVTPVTERRIWKQHAKHVLAGRGFGGRTLIPILYNHWVASESYRRQISRQLGLQFCDEGRDKTAACGGGSSFDGYGTVSRRVFDRWQQFRDDSDFWHMIDFEMEALAAKLFGLRHPLKP